MAKSVMDELTGLPRGIEDVLKAALAEEEMVALALLDLDHFMEINTDFGRDAGDKVLQVTAALLSQAVPGGALRNQGDEFALVMPGFSLEQAFLKVEAVRAKIAEAAAQYGLPDGRIITITAGVAHWPRDGKDVAALMRAAYAALSVAKEGGRNQVALPPNEEMIMKSCYYASSSVRKLKVLAEKTNKKESRLLREALDDLLRKYDA